MARALSDDLRIRVLKASTEGLSARGAAARFGVGISTAIRWIARARTGERTARPQGRRRGSSLDVHEAFIVALIEERRDITLHEMAARLLAEHAVAIRRSALSAWLRRRGWTFKKKSAHALEQERPDLLKRRRDWFEAQPDLDPRRLVFIDETGLSTKMARLRGRAPRGERCRAGIPHGHVWTPRRVQEESSNRMRTRDRVQPCVRRVMRRVTCRGPVWECRGQSTSLERARSAPRGSPDPIRCMRAAASLDRSHQTKRSVIRVKETPAQRCNPSLTQPPD